MNDHAKLDDLDRRMTRIEVTLWGASGANGVRGDLAELRRKMDMLLRFFWFATAIPTVTVAVLGTLRFLGRL